MNPRLSAPLRLRFLLLDQLGALLSDALQQDARRLVIRILRDESALDGLLENGRTELRRDGRYFQLTHAFSSVSLLMTLMI